jgi:hypothetical protein
MFGTARRMEIWSWCTWLRKTGVQYTGTALANIAPALFGVLARFGMIALRPTGTAALEALSCVSSRLLAGVYGTALLFWTQLDVTIVLALGSTATINCSTY